jgi:hypothetical protein
MVTSIHHNRTRAGVLQKADVVDPTDECSRRAQPVWAPQSFGQLCGTLRGPPRSRRAFAKVLAELLRRVALAPRDLPDADDLTAAAGRLFIELERREQSQ